VRLVTSRTLALGVALLAAWTLTAAAAELRIEQKDRAFSAREITLRVGDRLTLGNRDDTRHNVFSERGAIFDVVQPPGAAHTVTVTEPGDLDVQCAIHPRMKLRVRVVP
jgi:plastocyanin